MWEQALPDHPNLRIMKNRVYKRGWLSRLLGR